MKKQFFKIIAVCFSLVVAFNENYAQALNAKDNFGANRIDCNSPGSTPCAGSVKLFSGQERNTEANLQILKVNENRIVFKYLKNGMSQEQENANFKGRYFYIIPENIILDNSFQEIYQKTNDKYIYIEQGIYPIIEWEDSYLISFKIIEQ